MSVSTWACVGHSTVRAPAMPLPCCVPGVRSHDAAGFYPDPNAGCDLCPARRAAWGRGCLRVARSSRAQSLDSSATLVASQGIFMEASGTSGCKT